MLPNMESLDTIKNVSNDDHINEINEYVSNLYKKK